MLLHSFGESRYLKDARVSHNKYVRLVAAQLVLLTEMPLSVRPHSESSRREGGINNILHFRLKDSREIVGWGTCGSHRNV